MHLALWECIGAWSLTSLRARVWISIHFLYLFHPLLHVKVSNDKDTFNFVEINHVLGIGCIHDYWLNHIMLVGYWVARHRFRTSRIFDRNVETYGKLIFFALQRILKSIYVWVPKSLFSGINRPRVTGYMERSEYTYTGWKWEGDILRRQNWEGDI